MSTTNSRGKRAVGYARVSESDQTSVPEQLDWIKRACATEGLDLVRTFSDQGISGSEIDQRHELQAILDFSAVEFKAGRTIDVLAVWDLDRFSRADSLDTAAMLAGMRRDGLGRVLTNTDGWIDLHSDMDRVLLNLRQDLQRSAFAPALSRNVLRSMAARAKLGLWMGGPIPFGYRLKDDRLTAGPDDEVTLVRWMFRTYAENDVSTFTLARHAAKFGVRWNRNGVYQRLVNRAYIGDFVWNQDHVGKHSCYADDRVQKDQQSQQRELHKRRYKLKHLPVQKNDPEHVVIIPNNHPPLIDRELFDAVQRKLAANQRKRSPGKRHEWALSGMVFCGHCGSPVWCVPQHRVKTVAGRRKDYLYRLLHCSRRRVEGPEACPGGVPHHDEILKEVVGILQAKLGDEPARQSLRSVIEQQACQRTEEIARQRADLRGRLESLNRDLGIKARRMLDVPDDLRGEAQNVVREVKKERDDAVEQLAKLDKERDGISTRESERIRLALDAVKNLDKLLDYDDQESIRDALAGLITAVRIYFAPITPDQRKGKGRGRRLFVTSKVEVTLHPSIADLLSAETHNSTVPRTR